METGRKDIICPLPGGMRRKRAAELFGAGAGLRRLSGREKTLLIDRLRPACSLGSMTCLPGIAPGGRGVRRFRGRVRVPQGQGHAPNPRLGEGAPQPRAITCTVQAGENHTIITIDNTTRPPENAADAEDLIQPFHRGDDTRMANRPGHGLGLSIAKACTDAMQALTRHLPSRNQATEQADAAPLPAAEGTWTPPSCRAIGIILLIQPRLHLPRDVCGGRN